MENVNPQDRYKNTNWDKLPPVSAKRPPAVKIQGGTTDDATPSAIPIVVPEDASQVDSSSAVSSSPAVSSSADNIKNIFNPERTPVLPGLNLAVQNLMKDPDLIKRMKTYQATTSAKRAKKTASKVGGIHEKRTQEWDEFNWDAPATGTTRVEARDKAQLRQSTRRAFEIIGEDTPIYNSSGQYVGTIMQGRVANYLDQRFENLWERANPVIAKKGGKRPKEVANTHKFIARELSDIYKDDPWASRMLTMTYGTLKSVIGDLFIGGGIGGGLGTIDYMGDALGDGFTLLAMGLGFEKFVKRNPFLFGEGATTGKGANLLRSWIEGYNLAHDSFFGRNLLGTGINTDGFTVANARPTIMNWFTGVQLPPTIANIIMDNANPTGSNLMSILSGHLAVGVPSGAMVTTARLVLGAKQFKRFQEYAQKNAMAHGLQAGPVTPSILGKNPEVFHAMVESFMLGELKKFGRVPFATKLMRGIKEQSIMRSMHYEAGGLAARLQIKSRGQYRKIMQGRVARLVKQRNKVYLEGGSQKAIEDLTIKIRHAEMNAFLASKFNRVISNPVARQEGLAEFLFSVGASLPDWLNGGEASSFNILTGLGSVLAFQRLVPRLATKGEATVREAAMDMYSILRFMRNKEDLRTVTDIASTTVLKGGTTKKWEKGDDALEILNKFFSPGTIRRLGFDDPSVWYSLRRPTEGETFRKVPWKQRNQLSNIMQILQKHGLDASIPNMIEDADRLGRKVEEFGGDRDAFNLSFAKVTALTPLLILNSAETGIGSITTGIGRLKLKAFDKSIGTIKDMKLMSDEIEKLMEKILPAGADLSLVPKDVRNMIDAMKRVVNEANQQIVGLADDLTTAITRTRVHLDEHASVYLPDKSKYSKRIIGQELDDLENTLAKLEIKSGVGPEIAGVSRDAAESTQRAIARAEEIESEMTGPKSEAATFLRRYKTYEQWADLNAGRVIDPNLENRLPYKAIIELAQEVRDHVDKAFTKRFEKFFAEVGDNTAAVDNFGDDIFVLLYNVQNLDEKISLFGRTTIGQAERRRLADIVETNATRILDDYYRVKYPDEYDQIKAKEADIAKIKKSLGTDRELPDYILLSALSTNEKLGIKFTMKVSDMEELRRAIANRRLSVDNNVSKKDYRKLEEELEKGIKIGIGSKEGVDAYDALKTDYTQQVGVRFYETRIGKMLYNMSYRDEPAISGSDAPRNFFDLNKLFGENRQVANDFAAELRAYFGIKQADGSYLLDKETVFDMGEGRTKGIRKVHVGKRLSPMLNTLLELSVANTDAFRKLDTVIKEWGDISPYDKRRKLVQYISGLSKGSIEGMYTYRGFNLLGDLLNAEGDVFSRSLYKIFNESENFKKEMAKVNTRLDLMIKETAARKNALQNLSSETNNINLTMEIAKGGIKTVDEFMDALLLPGSITADTLESFVINCAKHLKKDVEEIREALFYNATRRLNQRAYSDIKIDRPDGKKDIRSIADETSAIFDSEKFYADILRLRPQLETLFPNKKFKVLIDGEGADAKGYKFIEMDFDEWYDNLVDFATLFRNAQTAEKLKTPKGLYAWSTRGLSPSSYISRIYNMRRGIVGPKWVITEALLMRWRGRNQAQLTAILEDPELMYYMQRIMMTRDVLPPKMGSRFNIALQRAIAHGIHEDRKTDLTVPFTGEGDLFKSTTLRGSGIPTAIDYRRDITKNSASRLAQELTELRSKNQ